MIDYVKDLKDGFRPTLLAYQDGQRAGERASERRRHEQGPQEGYDNGYDNGYADGQADMANTRDRVAEREALAKKADEQDAIIKQLRA